MMKKQIILALDQGTSSSRSLLVDQNLVVLAQASVPLKSFFPQPGWVEQDPWEVWGTQKKTIDLVLEQAGVSLDQVTAIGITNQRETTIAWNKDTGEPLGPAIVWQCRRTTGHCQSLKDQGLEPLYRAKTGLVLDPYFSGTKMAWMLEHYPKARGLAAQGKLAFGTVDSWLVYNLSDRKAHVTDASNASRTLLFDLHQRAWDVELTEPLGIPLSSLPEVVDSSGVLAYSSAKFGAEVPIAGIAGDQQASLFGQACFKPGMAKNTYGTGCFMLTNTGSQPLTSKNGLLSTLGWQIDGQATYALEGSVFMGGALLQWLRDQMGFFEEVTQTESMALAVPDNGGVYLVPAFAGLGAPHWDPYARGLLIGLTQHTNKNHVVRAALEAIAYQTAELALAMEADFGKPLTELRIDGGGSNNAFLCQFQADLLGFEVTRPEHLESTALGAAMLAGLATGVWGGVDELSRLWGKKETLRPRPMDCGPLWDGWHKAVSRAKGWAQ